MLRLALVLALASPALADDWTGKTIKAKTDGIVLGRKLGGGIARDGATLDTTKTYTVKSDDGTLLELPGGYIFKSEAEAVADAKPIPKDKAKESDPAADKGEWFGKKVLPKRNSDTIRIGDWVDGKQEYWTPHDLLNSTVREDKDGFLRLYDGRREGWVDKNDMVTEADAPVWWDKAVKANPKDTHALNMRGLGWLDKGEFDNAIKDFTDLLSLEPDSSFAYNNRGFAWDSKKEFDKAIADYTEAIRLDPKNAGAYNNRGYAWSKKKDYDKAIADHTIALRLDPKDASAFSNRGVAWGSKKDYDKAIADYTEAINIDPKFARAYYNRGLTWYNKNEHDKAIADCTEAININPKYVNAYYNCGLAWSKKKEYSKAIDEYNRALSIDPKHANAIGARGLAYHNMAQYQKALDAYTEAVALNAKWDVLYALRARTFAKLKKYDQALQDFKHACDNEPGQWTHLRQSFFLATCPDAKYRDGKKAVELAKLAIEKAGKDMDWEYYDTLAAAQAEAGDFELAVVEQRKALEMLKAEKYQDKDDVKKAEARLELYRAKKPYRDEE